ncbi:L,D-transpeptidase family protein [Acetonema longum]|uniref:L,D-TPase catalytic domain-containing protein n=1 Tax=Acetonema longum DSM 6540 TaxID=1009370 RepID=F7NDJ1_9FIRM|nr:L,D-transpeptidase family protein [Acetonema longum]EGO65853.1 hypothetical protein ALO_00490 [Acetonema longum DSM 6540]
MRYNRLAILIVLIVIFVLAFAVWRGFPPFQLHTSAFPGLLHQTNRQPKQIEVKIYKSERRLMLYGDGNIIGIFRIARGFAPVGNKEKEGDGKTPEGNFVICYINDKTPYVYFYGLNYPNVKDAERGLKQGLISSSEYQQIVSAAQMGGIPLWKTPLGGEVGIHGGGSLWDWTQGCVAVSDADILILKEYLTIGTPVEIFP